MREQAGQRSSFARQVHIDGGFSPDSIFVRTNFLIPDYGRATPVNGNALYVGRLSDEKGVDTIIDAWNTYGLPIRLQIVGSGPTESKLHALARSNSFIDFTGQLNECNVQEAMANARFVIMSSRWYETFGRTMAEAFSRGTPVIASRLGAMIELVRDGTNGFLFDPGNSESLAETVNRFLEQGESGRQVHSQGAHSPSRARSPRGTAGAR